MALILTRSPYHISRGTLDANAGLVVEISTNVDGVATIVNSYNLNFRNKTHIDISSIVSSELSSENKALHVRITLSGTIDGVSQSDQVSDYVALDGYLYSTDDYNEDLSSVLSSNAYYAGSSDVVYKLDSSSLNVPLLNASLTEISSNSVINGDFATDSDWTKESADWTISNGASFLNSTDYSIDRLYQLVSGLNGSELRVRFEIKDYSGDGEASMRYPISVEITGNGVYEAHGTGDLDRVQFQAEADDLANPLSFSLDNVFVSVVNSNSYEEVTVQAKYNSSVVGTETVAFNSDTDSTYNNVSFNIDDIDEVTITSSSTSKTIKVNPISECKYSPYILTFKNRYGVDEDLWFFKKSKRKLTVDSEEFMASQVDTRIAGGLTRSIQEYNKNGKESITLNSGFVVEALNESFKQLLLSEEVKLYDFDNSSTQAVKLSLSSLDYKTITNDKLINYTIEVEFSNNIIDDIV